jgi:hypothetical protein
MLQRSIAFAALALATAAPALANGTPVRVTVTGTVEYNLVSAPPLGNFDDNDPVELSFLVYSGDFVNSPSFPVRGYRIDRTSFELKSGGDTLALQSPWPAGMEAYFSIRNNDPGVDGFMVTRTVASPGGVPLNQNGGFGPLNHDFYVTYGGSTLASLDILAAVGTYDFTGLTVFNWTVDDGPSNPTGMLFEKIVIEALPAGPTNYCTAKLNSQGCTPTLAGDAGLPSVSAGPWNVTGTNLINNKPGIFIWGHERMSLPFQNGFLCVAAPFLRTPGQFSGGNPGADDCSGTMTLDLTTALVGAFAPTMITLQAWQRDVVDPFGSGLTDAIEVLLCP